MDGVVDSMGVACQIQGIVYGVNRKAFRSSVYDH